MIDPDAQREIGIVLYPGAQLAAVHGLTDLFCFANRFAGKVLDRAPLRVSHWGMRENCVTCLYCSEPLATPAPSILILPPTLGDLPDPDNKSEIVRWLLHHHRLGVTLVTICSGIFFVAATGLLDGRIISTHRICAQALAERFPEIGVDVEQRIIEDPDMLSAGGFMAWVDVALLLIERLLGSDVRAETAGFILPVQVLRAEHDEAAFPLKSSQSDPSIQRVLEFVHLRDGQGVSLDAMIAAARLGRRTFLRRFKNATGITPIEYCRTIRIARAREFLEASNTPLKVLAETLGYKDPSAFSRAFHRSCGMPPGMYRGQNGGRFGA